MTHMPQADISVPQGSREHVVYPDPRVPVPANGRFGAARYAEALRALRRRPHEALSVYVHVPFCPVRCLYCGCHTTITHSAQKIDRYLDSLEREMALVTQLVGRGRDLVQFHLGGGTPNYLTESQLVRLMGIVERHFRILDSTDTAMECNPRRASAGQLALIRGLGFRRVSFGVQDFEPDVQRAIGRIQSVEMIRDVYWTAREMGFQSINLDLVYGLPNQTERSFQTTLDEVIDLGPDRVTCFGYAHLPDSRPHQYGIDVDSLPSSFDRLALFQRAVNFFTASGYTWIGLDCFVLDTDPLAVAQKNHRLNWNCVGYSVIQPAHVLAFGASGIGEVDGVLVQNATTLKVWQEAVDGGRLPVVRGQRLGEADRSRREAIIQLMCNLELPLSRVDLDGDDALVRYVEDGLLEVVGERVRITPRGRYFLRDLCMERDAYLEWDNAHWQFTRPI